MCLQRMIDLSGIVHRFSLGVFSKVGIVVVDVVHHGFAVVRVDKLVRSGVVDQTITKVGVPVRTPSYWRSAQIQIEKVGEYLLAHVFIAIKRVCEIFVFVIFEAFTLKSFNRA